MNTRSGGARVTAVLGPTNTGKTFLALERMTGHATGMIGFPLRLLARENYEKIVRLKGQNAVALMTGEEKIVPPNARYFVCTVESMPLDRRVAFMAIDEIQLCADPERGHVFTDRLLHARGEEETMFLGAETIKPLLRRLVPEAEFVTRPRFSRLTYTGPRKLTRLPPRSAIVAFSASDVYAMAEFVRRQRGGAAVVLGALSPRTRNAQVGLYQAGEVDYLVATDAIGMGLNMDVDHVAFAATRKFDGRVPRPLDAAEVAQIAGRAGRHMSDGSFGTTGDSGGIDPEIVEAVENHTFAPLKGLSWRNSSLRFTSVGALLHSLALPPEVPGLLRAREADDHLALQTLAREESLLARVQSPDRVRLLWDVCQIPDFRKSLAEAHTRLLSQIFHHLTDPDGRLPDDWLANHVKRLDRTDGDIETIIGRIANVRTWTYVAHRSDWVADPLHWQGWTRQVEDRLSDALHLGLTQRFVDKRTAVLVRRLKDKGELLSAIDKAGEVLVEGQFVGRLDGFRFAADRSETAHGARAVSSAAQRALRGEIRARVRRLAQDDDACFALCDDGSVAWQGAAVGRLVPGPDPLRPAVEVLSSDLLESDERDAVRRRLGTWLAEHLRGGLKPLYLLREADLTGAARGLGFQVAEALGSVRRERVEAQIAALSEAERKALARLGVRLGVETVFLPALLKPAQIRLRALLWCAHAGLAQIAAPPAGRVTVATDRPAPFLEAVGFRPLGARAVRIDMLERFAAIARRLAHGASGFRPTAELMGLIGLGPKETGEILAGLGFRSREADDGSGPVFHARRPKAKSRPRPSAHRTDSPFALLKAR
jgi:ATP-dependent RNA helicase SUPV3L1/SUV3